MLRIPRPRTRGECLAEARPCPWTACRHALLHEVVPATGALLLHAKGQAGRRPHLTPSCDDDTLTMWIGDALSTLVGSAYSCSLDAADEGGLTHAEVGEALRVGREQAELEANAALRKLYVLTMRACDIAVDEERLPPIKHLARWIRAMTDA